MSLQTAYKPIISLFNNYTQEWTLLSALKVWKYFSVKGSYLQTEQQKCIGVNMNQHLVSRKLDVLANCVEEIFYSGVTFDSG